LAKRDGRFQARLHPRPTQAQLILDEPFGPTRFAPRNRLVPEYILVAQSLHFVRHGVLYLRDLHVYKRPDFRSLFLTEDVKQHGIEQRPAVCARRLSTGATTMPAQSVAGQRALGRFVLIGTNGQERRSQWTAPPTVTREGFDAAYQSCLWMGAETSVVTFHERDNRVASKDLPKFPASA